MAAISTYQPSYIDKLFDNELLNGQLFPVIESSYNLDKPYFEHFNDSNMTRQCISVFPSKNIFRDKLVILYFHGNSCDLGDVTKRLRTFSIWMSCSIIGIEYSGYGCSQGPRRQDAIIQKCADTIAYLRDTKSIPLSRMILFGQSIGCSIALKLNTLYKSAFHGLILISPFINIKQLAEYHELKSSLLITESVLSNLEEIKQMKQTQFLLIAHGKDDTVIPSSHSEKLFKECPLDELKQHKFLFIQEKANHNVFDKDSLHWEILLPFFRHCEKNVLYKQGEEVYVDIKVLKTATKIIHKKLRKKQTDIWLSKDGKSALFEADFDDNKIYKHGASSTMIDFLKI